MLPRILVWQSLASSSLYNHYMYGAPQDLSLVLFGLIISEMNPAILPGMLQKGKVQCKPVLSCSRIREELQIPLLAFTWHFRVLWEFRDATGISRKDSVFEEIL